MKHNDNYYRLIDVIRKRVIRGSKLTRLYDILEVITYYHLSDDDLYCAIKSINRFIARENVSIKYTICLNFAFDNIYAMMNIIILLDSFEYKLCDKRTIIDALLLQCAVAGRQFDDDLLNEVIERVLDKEDIYVN